MQEILDEFKNLTGAKVSDLLLMKLAVIQNICPNIVIGTSGTKFDSSLVDESHLLEHDLAQPCSDLLFNCTLNDVDLDCMKIFKSFSTDLGHCCSFNILPAILHWEVNSKSDRGKKKFK